MNRFSRSVLFFLLMVSYFGCKGDKPSIPETESNVLNELLQQAPVSSINLLQQEPDITIIPAENIIPLPESDGGTPVLDRPTQAHPFGDHLVVMQFRSADVAVINRQGQLVKRLGTEDGLEQPVGLMSDSERLYIYDDQKELLQVYDSDYVLRDSIPFNGPYFSQGSTVMTPSYIAYQPDEATGFRASSTGRHLLEIAPKEKPDSTVFRMFPRIVPAGKHPGGYNNLSFSINKNDEIVGAYPALPYLFIYRNFDHSYTILLESDRFTSVDNPPLKPTEPVMGEAVTVRSLLGHLHLMNNGDILLFSQGILHHIAYNEGEYRLRRSVTLVRGDTGEEIGFVSSMEVHPTDPNRVIVTGDGVLFILNLSG